MIKRVLTALTIVFCLAVGLTAQEEKAPLTVYSGAVKYNNPAFDSVVLVEFPFVLNRHEFEFFQPDTTDPNYYARIFAQVILLNVEGQAIDSATTYFSVKVPTLEEARKEGLKLFNKLSLIIKPGIYSSRLTVIDAVSKKEGEFFNGRLIVEPAWWKNMAATFSFWPPVEPGGCLNIIPIPMWLLAMA